MLKKAVFVLAVATVLTASADCLDRLYSGGFDDDIKHASIEFATLALGQPDFRPGAISKPIEFIESNIFANIAIGRSDGRRPGVVSKSIEFAGGGPHWPKPPKEGDVTGRESIEFASNTNNGGLCPPLLCSDGVNPT